MNLDDILGAAAAASPGFAAVDGPARAAFLKAIADELESIGDAVVVTADRETHLGETRLRGELTRTTNQLRMFADLVTDASWQGARIDIGPPDIRRMLIPLGPVAVFGASNFPLAFSVPGGDTASALAAGCPVVCKAHPAHPDTSELCAAAIQRAVHSQRMPDGVFALLTDTSVEAGQRLVADDRVEAVAFTGSLPAGRALYDLAASRARPIPVYAEMGSINPVFVLPGAAAQRGEQIAAELADSITLGVGQFCTNPGVTVALAGTLRQVLTSAMADRPAGMMLTTNIAEQYVRNLSALIASGPSLATGAVGAGQPSLATVGAATFVDRPELHREVFGPASLLVEAATDEELLAVARSLEGQLTATVYATDEELAASAELIGTLTQRVGRVIANGVPTGVAVNRAIHHGGPYPASTDARTSSVGTTAIERFVRPVCYQGFPDGALPPLLRDANPLGALRLVNGSLSTRSVDRTSS
jgi:alpha-ketoglutaric semialdehyde dehydrogenase